MTYNIHPILVHFPIALLLIYSFIKIVPFKRWFPNVSWKHIEIALLVFGVLGAFVASSTGELAEELVNPDRQLVEMHSVFAAASTWFYGLILVGEILSLINPFIILKFNIPPITKLLVYIQQILTNEILSILLAFLGLIAITVTGLLGGVMVYGLTADPIAPIVLQILGISI